MADTLSELTALIQQDSAESDARAVLASLFGSRYYKNTLINTMIRDARILAASAEDSQHVPFAGLIHPDNPPSGPYGGACVVWFPSKENGSLLALGIGTRGLTPDEGLLMRPGHRRRVSALRRYLAKASIEVWAKPDPALLDVDVPTTIQQRFAGFESTFKRYGKHLYCIAKVPEDETKARQVVQAFFDLYAYERGWQVYNTVRDEFDKLVENLREQLFITPDANTVFEVLKNRRFVVLQGPPGTGKTHLAEQIKHDFFGGRGMTIQFHPATTYEDFIVGLSPEPDETSLKFNVRPGKLLEAAHAAKEGPYLLVIDEINRADLSKVLGEAIYLFEAGEVGGNNPRMVDLLHKVDGASKFAIPKNLYILGTMNTADRSISGMDLAVRRRFAFISMPPQRKVIEGKSVRGALQVFDMLLDVFVDYAPEDAMDLMPGHAYFLARSDEELRGRLKYELLPLLDEYLREGYLGPGSISLHAVRDRIEDMVS